MDELGWEEPQVRALLSAMRAVAEADGPMSPRERDLIAATGTHLFDTKEDVAVLPPGSPDALGAVLTDPADRELAVQLLVLVPYADTSVDSPEVGIVDRYAAALGTLPSSLADLHAVRDDHIKRLGLDYARRAIGKISEDGLGGRARMIVSTLHQYVGDARVAQRFHELQGFGGGTLGHTFFTFYRDRGFPLPGEKHSLGEYFVGHDSAHILGGFNTDGVGEIGVAGFEAGMSRDGFGYEMIMEVLLDYQLGIDFGGQSIGFEPKVGELDPGLLMTGIQRGLESDVDLIEGWDFWADADQQVVELRERYRIVGVEGVVIAPPPDVAPPPGERAAGS